MKDNKQIYLDVLERLDLNKKEDFLIYNALLNNIKKYFKEDIKYGNSILFKEYKKKLNSYIPEFPLQGWESSKYNIKDLCNMSSLEEVRIECIRINNIIKNL